MTSTTTATVDELMTGEEYLESLRDGREVWLHGEKVADVTTHPAFRNAARSIARLYDSFHDPQQRDILTTVDDFGIRTHKFFKPSTTAQELAEARDAIAAWARMSYGFMGRTHANAYHNVSNFFDVPLRPVLVREMQNFTVKINPQTAHDSYGAWRENEHDDLVYALAMAAWQAETRHGVGRARAQTLDAKHESLTYR